VKYGETMYLKKRNRDNLEGSIAWLEQTINDGIDPKLNPETVLDFLKSILENKQ